MRLLLPVDYKLIRTWPLGIFLEIDLLYFGKSSETYTLNFSAQLQNLCCHDQIQNKLKHKTVSEGNEGVFNGNV